MASSAAESLLRWRWLVVALVALSVVTMEFMEHRPHNLVDADGDFIREVLLFGAVLPLTSGAMMGALARRMQSNGASAQGHADRRRIFVVENSLLLGAGVESLLSQETDLEVAGTTPEDEKALLEAVGRYDPDVVVLGAVTTDATRLCDLLRTFPGLEVVVVSADDDRMQVFHKHQVLYTRADDLVHVVRHG